MLNLMTRCCGIIMEYLRILPFLVMENKGVILWVFVTVTPLMLLIFGFDMMRNSIDFAYIWL